jgi:hypothetical protein
MTREASRSTRAGASERFGTAWLPVEIAMGAAYDRLATTGYPQVTHDLRKLMDRSTTPL